MRRITVGQDDPSGGLVTFCGNRRYDLRSIEKTTTRLKITLRAESAGRIHVDTLDLYSAKARRALCADLCRFHAESPDTIDVDIATLVRFAENAPPPQLAGGAPDAPRVTMTDAERAEALEFGRQPDLFDNILSDYKDCGLVGEESNKLVCYLAAVSRKMTDPFSVLILSSSGAGKTALQDATLRLCPPEDVIRLTSLTGKSLFYKSRNSLKHKILAIEENAGAEDAGYAIRCLISSGELTVESTVKDLSTGKLTTAANRVEGPTAVFITTTDPDLNPETRSRFLVLSVDESREQTRAILEHQRRQHTVDGLMGESSVASILTRHRNFQRLLKPLAVVNPFAAALSYTDDRLQSRRDQPKYLNLVKAVTFLRQMQKPVKVAHGVAFVEADQTDVATADRLLRHITGGALEELSVVSRNLLALIERMVEYHAVQGFTRRQIREFTGWAHSRVERYLAQLTDMEYVLVDKGRNGVKYVYRLASQRAEPSHLPSTFSEASAPSQQAQPVATEPIAIQPACHPHSNVGAAT